MCAGAIGQPNVVMAASGQHIYSRHEINEIIQRLTAPDKKVRRLPAGLLHAALPLWKILNRNLYDKLAFFNEMASHELIAPRLGETSLETYFSKPQP